MINRCAAALLWSICVLPPTYCKDGLAESPLIARIDWAPKESIIRQAKGSDRFPMTWASDDAQYTAWGDGVGFGKTERKLSLGYARISGPPESFAAEDVRSATGEAVGDGRAGYKASGLLSVAGTLYLWVGNADRAGAQSRLAWSSDHAKTWTWADWKFEEFGYISLINFGKDYSGARDEFVYGVAHDHPSEYVPADRFVMMRVPRHRLRERDAYEFIQRLDGRGQPDWTGDIKSRDAIYTERGACLRQQITYCAPLKRYLWWQQRPNLANVKDVGDTRFEGGFVILDGPEPWGPWTKAFAADQWDVGPGETASFPTKWMSPDGRTLHLVFSGDDFFSVRKATVVLR
jgi:hypothetical protein